MPATPDIHAVPRQLHRAGEIRSVKIGKVRRIPVAALAAYVERLQGE